MYTHHRITLVLREEPEGHGTLFLDWGGGTSESLEALAIVPNDGMGGGQLVSILSNTLSIHLTAIADALATATIEGDLKPIGSEHLEDVAKTIATERADVLLHFLSWLERNGYTIYNGPEKGPIDDIQELFNHYAEERHNGQAK